MAARRVSVVLLLLSSCIWLPSARAEGFLSSTGAGHKVVSIEARSEELQAALGSVLGCTASGRQSPRTAENHQILKPIWQSLPKNQHGRVEWRLLRYIAHRHFMQRFGVLVRGLEPTIQVNTSHAGEAEILSRQAPALAQQIVGPQAEHGFSLDDAAAMMAALEQLLFDSDRVLLEKVYKDRGWTVNEVLSRERLQGLLKDFMVYWMFGEDQEMAVELLKKPSLIPQSLPQWYSVASMVEGSVRALEFTEQRSPRPGKPHAAFSGHFTFEDALEVVGKIGRNFGSFWETQCQDTKASLIALDTQGTGRLRLPDFYGANKEGEWRFGESEAYLRELGALDETSSWRGSQVIVSNYMQAASNCVVMRPHYLVCCRIECEAILSEVEEAMGTPVASVDGVLQVVGNMTRSNDEPVKIDNTLRDQLLRVARKHGGMVPLHGRLFAQWLHYVFPRECAFPHKAGAVASLTPAQFGEESVVSMDEVHKRVAEDVVQRDLAAGVNISGGQWMTQWSEDEELLGDYSRQFSRPWEKTHVVAVGGVAAAAVMGLMWASVREAKPVKPATHFI